MLLAADLTWWMAERLVADDNGLLIVPNDISYAQPAEFEIAVDTSEITLPEGSAPSDFEFEITDHDGQIVEALFSPSAANVYRGLLPLGTYELSVTGNAPGDSPDANQSDAGSVTAVAEIEVRDILFVALGDSYASGEGNPESNAGFFDDEKWLRADDQAGFSEQDRWHRSAHRSSFAAPAQAALMMEQADPHSSVTFVFLAESGATIEAGGLSDYVGISEDNGLRNGELFPSQLEQLSALVGNRPIDRLTMSFGGNDVGFSRILTSLLLADSAVESELIVSAATSGSQADWEAVWDEVTFLPEWILEQPSHAIAGLNGMASEFIAINQAFSDNAINVSPHDIYLTEYPDLSTTLSDDRQVTTCSEILDDVTFLGSIDSMESDLIRERVMLPLVDIMQASANTFGWNLVTGLSDAFAGHGYCSPRAMLSDGEVQNPDVARWFVTYDQSNDQQDDTSGTAHPNALGHSVLASALLQAMTDDGDVNYDLRVDARDIDALFAKIDTLAPDPPDFSVSDVVYDLNQDGLISKSDVDFLIRDLLATDYGDVDLNGTVDEQDFNRIQASLFRSGTRWASGDMNGDSVTDGSDSNIWTTNRNDKNVEPAAAQQDEPIRQNTARLRRFADQTISRRLRRTR